MNVSKAHRRKGGERVVGHSDRLFLYWVLMEAEVAYHEGVSGVNVVIVFLEKIKSIYQNV